MTATKDWAVYALTSSGEFRTQHNSLREAREAANGWRDDYTSDTGDITKVTIERRNHNNGRWDLYESVPLGDQR